MFVNFNLQYRENGPSRDYLFGLIIAVIVIDNYCILNKHEVNYSHYHLSRNFSSPKTTQ